ncbi:MAG: putative long chain acyl-CoA synthase [Solirubrobacteraceae bacterium]|jgi:putative long chain acyl-CoA synthase|nr:putative long chain acyl-CoA synthase [Solirubrobacteraceae bacterium]
MCDIVELVPKRITRPVSRLGAAAQNALEVARFGGLTTDEKRSPYEVASEHRVYRLRHYYADGHGGGPPVLLVPPMMLAAEIYDVSPATSAVTTLHDNGADPWVVDFGAPEREEGGLERTLADHVVAVSDAVDRVREATGRDVHLGGYSQGGMFCYQAAAYRRNDGLGSLITFGSPVDTRLAMPFGMPEQLASGLAGLIVDGVLRGGALPAWASRTGFRLLDPVKSARSRIEFILQLHDREALLPREGQRRFLEADGWVAWPGPAMADFLHQFIAHNRMLEGGFVIKDRLLTLADIACPILSVVGSVDEIAPAAGVRAIRLAAPRADVYELCLDAGHFGLVVGSTANTQSWPTVAAWTRWRDGEGELPAAVTEVPDDPAADLESAVAVRNRVGYGLELAGAVSNGVARSLVHSARRTARGMRELSREAAGQLPRLARLEQVQPGTRISLGLLVQERVRRDPEDIFFLFEDRAHSSRDINERIDNVVRGLIAIGVRQGEHVGVLMGVRPSALAVTVALNRLGAVAVLLRPDGDTEREAALGQVQRIVADPERAAQAAGLGTVHTFVLGGGGGPRDLGIPLTGDMEQIDPRAVKLPKWYRPNPGRAGDLAFVLFTGEGESTRLSRVTNGRWVTSAFGTASSAALSSADTVYSVTPLYHPSGLMMSVGGAIAGGARLAMATTFAPSTFWEEVRRYGVTVASYTWTLLHDLVEAPPQPGERHHPVRLFIGSGMPRGLWRRVERRFAPARVLEFYASTETGAILVNLRDAKPGALGRRLPGSPDVRIAAYDFETGQLVLGNDGFVRACGTDEPGMLLARVRARDMTGTIALRGVFARDDAWLATGDLFRRDSDGDYWRLDGVREFVRGRRGPIFTTPIRDALSDLPAVDLAVVYAVNPPRRKSEVAVAAVTLRTGHRLSAEDLIGALGVVEPPQRPELVHVLDSIPVTTWYRPMTAPLRDAGLPEPGEGREVYKLQRGGRAYQRLEAPVTTGATSRG